jgi:hypothetical protein
MNRRAYERIEMSLLATIEHDGRSIPAVIENVSLNGLLLSTEETLPCEDTVTVHLPARDLGMASDIECCAQVVRHAERGIGVHISALSAEGFLTWRNLLAKAQEQADTHQTA